MLICSDCGQAATHVLTDRYTRKPYCAAHAETAPNPADGAILPVDGPAWLEVLEPLRPFVTGTGGGCEAIIVEGEGWHVYVTADLAVPEPWEVAEVGLYLGALDDESDDPIAYREGIAPAGAISTIRNMVAEAASRQPAP